MGTSRKNHSFYPYRSYLSLAHPNTSSSPMLLPLFLILFHSTFAASATTATLTLHPHDPNTPATSTIPAFPEQSDSSPTSSCPLSLPLRRPPSSLRPSCTPSPHHRLRCCPSLATLLFSSYPSPHPSSSPPGKQGGYDMPEVPQDAETCSVEVGKALADAGVDVSYRNASCDLVFCYCGIHLHRMSCEMEDRVFNDRVGSLARDCSGPGITGCSRCLTSLSKLRGSGTTALRSSNDGERTTKVHGDDCQLMGLAWLLARNHSAHARTVTSVFHAMMLTPDGTVPRSCDVGSDGLPLAVDSSQVSGNWTPSRGSAPWAVLASILIALLLPNGAVKEC